MKISTFIPALILVSIVVPLSSIAAGKMTVCSATLNSSEEVELFKRYLPAQDFNFVELTDYGDGDKKQFLPEACKAGVQCDILLISGHFGGTFFGSSQLRLPIEALEAGSCNQQCDGILKRPKEVFLFGCNTLAGKSKDQRTPEEYHRVLLADGIDADTADRVVAFRYSALGDSFSGRMSRVFSKTPRIYGFNSIGPSGKTIEPLLRPYLSKVGRQYTSMISRADKSPNQLLARALRETSFIQASGNPDFKQDAITCGGFDEKAPMAYKLKLVENTIRDNSYLNHVDLLKTVMEHYEWAKEYGSLTPEDKEIYARIVALNRSKEVLPLLREYNIALYGVQANLLSFMMKARWLSVPHASSILFKLATGDDLTKSFTKERADRICSKEQDMLTTPLEISPAIIPAARWKEKAFWEALDCLHPRGDDLGFFVLNKILNDRQWIQEISDNDIGDPVHLLSLTMFEEKSLRVTDAVLKALKETSSPQIQTELLSSFPVALEPAAMARINDVILQFALYGKTDEVQTAAVSNMVEFSECYGPCGPLQTRLRAQYQSLMPTLKKRAQERSQKNSYQHPETWSNFPGTFDRLEKKLAEEQK